MEMMKSNMNWKTLVMSILLFSVVSPVGILIGSVLISGEIAKSGWVVVIEVNVFYTFIEILVLTKNAIYLGFCFRDFAVHNFL
jgi:hypothetical protein